MSRPSEPGEAMELRRTIAALEEEVAQLRRRLREPRDHEVARLERELADAHRTIERLRSQNDKLATVLEEAREQLSVLRAEVEKLTTPPNNFGTVLQVNEDGTLDVMTGNRKLRVAAQPTIEVKQLTEANVAHLKQDGDSSLQGDAAREEYFLHATAVELSANS